jgi:hypothetical protein
MSKSSVTESTEKSVPALQSFFWPQRCAKFAKGILIFLALLAPYCGHFLSGLGPLLLSAGITNYDGLEKVE